jgi:hypothetical protein
MARIPSPLHDKTVPKRVSKPTVTAEAAATVAESAVAPPAAARKARVAKPAPVKTVVANKTKPAPAAAAPRKTTAANKATAAKKAKAAPKAESRPKAKVKSAPVAVPAKAAVVVAAAEGKAAKAHKPKLVRDSFTIPKDEYAVLEALKSRALGLGQHVRKSELLRAGIQALGAMSDAALLKAVGAVPTLKTGRPRKG